MKEILGKCTTKSSTLPTKITVNKTDKTFFNQNF